VALRRSICALERLGLGRNQAGRTDGLDTIRVCVGYRVGGEMLSETPLFYGCVRRGSTVYEEIPGWEQCTVGVKDLR